MIPTIRLTHSLQAMLLMTKCPMRMKEDEAWWDAQEPFPHFIIKIADPINAVARKIALIEARTRIVFGDWVSDELYDELRFIRVKDNGEERIMIYAPNKAGAASWDPRTFGNNAPSMYRLVYNLISYIHSLGGLRPEHTTQVQQAKHGKLKPGTNLRPDYLLGREIKLSPQLRALASADGPARYRFRSRWLVRGHFRQQPVGEGRAERRTTWIQPYWKGPTDGPVLVPRYVAGEDA